MVDAKLTCTSCFRGFSECCGDIKSPCCTGGRVEFKKTRRDGWLQDATLACTRCHFSASEGESSIQCPRVGCRGRVLFAKLRDQSDRLATAIFQDNHARAQRANERAAALAASPAWTSPANGRTVEAMMDALSLGLGIGVGGDFMSTDTGSIQRLLGAKQREDDFDDFRDWSQHPIANTSCLDRKVPDTISALDLVTPPDENDGMATYLERAVLRTYRRRLLEPEASEVTTIKEVDTVSRAMETLGAGLGLGLGLPKTPPSLRFRPPQPHVFTPPLPINAPWTWNREANAVPQPTVSRLLQLREATVSVP